MNRNSAFYFNYIEQTTNAKTLIFVLRGVSPCTNENRQRSVCSSPITTHRHGREDDQYAQQPIHLISALTVEINGYVTFQQKYWATVRGNSVPRTVHWHDEPKFRLSGMSRNNVASNGLEYPFVTERQIAVEKLSTLRGWSF